MFDHEVSDLTSALYEHGREIGYEILFLALLGKGDGLGTLLVPNGQPREIWARRSDTHELITCFAPPGWLVPLADGNPDIERMEVRIGKAPKDNRPIIIDNLSMAGWYATGTTSPMESLLYRSSQSSAADNLYLYASYGGM